MDLRKGIVVSQTNLIERKKETPLPWKGASAIILLALALIGGALYYNWSEKASIARLQNNINQIKQGRDYKKIALVADSEKRLQSIRAIRNERIDWGRIFQKIEENTIPEVTYSQMDAVCGEEAALNNPAAWNASNVPAGERCHIDFKGTTIGLDNLARQVSSFTETRDTEGIPFAQDVSIQKVEIKKIESESSEAKGAVDFTIQVKLNPEAFEKSVAGNR